MNPNAKTLPLSELATFKSGSTPSKSKTDYWGGDLPWVSAKDLKSPEVVDSIDRLSETGFAAAKIAPAGSLLILVRGMTLHKDVPVCIAGRDVAFNQDIKALIVTEKISPKYLLYFLHSRKNGLLDLVDSAGHGTGRLNTDSLKAFPVLVPPIPDQTAIANLLSTWDAAIEKSEKLITAKEKRFLWLQNYLISHHSTSTSYKMLRLIDIMTESRLPDLEGDPEKRITVRLHLKGVEAREYRGTETDGATTFYKRRSGQFIYGKQNIFKGSLGMVPSKLDGYSSSQDIPAFDIDDSVVSPDWFYFYISRPSFYKRLEVYAAGSGSKRLHPKELLKLSIKLPPLPIQNEIAEEIACYKKEIDLLRTILEAYRKQKRGLMQRLLTGNGV